MADIRIVPGSSIMSFTSSLNFTEKITQDASGSLNLYGSGSTGRTEIFSVDGNNGRLFSVSDDLSDSLFSVNTIAGLPVIEAFADNTVKIGKYGQENIVVSGSNTAISGSLILSSTGVANSPSLRINTSTSATFIHTQENFASNMTSGQHAMIWFGHDGSTKNAGGIGYYWSGGGSNSNFITLGHWGNDDIFRIYGDGTVSVGTNTILHAGNYTSYAPTLTGGGASGTWGIGISGNAATATSSGLVSRTGSTSNANTMFSDTSAGYLGWQDAYNPTNGAGSEWYNYLTMRHENAGSQYGTQLAISWSGTDTIKYRSVYGASFTSWKTVLDSNNYTSYNSYGALYVNNWFRAYGNSGFYAQDYGSSLTRTINASHGTWEVSGYNKGSYAGMNIYDASGYINNYMHEGGNGGLYLENQGGQWAFYWSRANACLGLGGSSTSSSYKIYVNGGIYATGDVVAYSDRRKKKNITTIDNALEKVLKLRGVYYDKIDELEKGRKTGVIAQEIQEVLPEVVTYAEDNDEYGVAYGNIVGVLIEAIKEQQTQIEELKQLVNQLIQK